MRHRRGGAGRRKTRLRRGRSRKRINPRKRLARRRTRYIGDRM